jgi:hypothetical protein
MAGLASSAPPYMITDLVHQNPSGLAKDVVMVEGA